MKSLSKEEQGLLLKDVAFGVMLLLASLSVWVALVPLMPSGGLDPSWALSMAEAVKLDFVFGEDIAFTYGPYASIATGLYHPATDNLMLYGGLYLAFYFAILSFLSFVRLEWYCNALLLLALSAFVRGADSLCIFFPLMVGCYVRQAIVDRKYLSTKYRFLLVFLLFSPLGLLPLIKGSFIFACLGVVLCSCVILAIHSLWKEAFFACFVSLASVICFWGLSGQPLMALPLYFKAMMPIAGGYTQAMSKFGGGVEVIFYVIASVAVIYGVFLDAKGRLVERVSIAFMFFVTLFLGFKAGFVRNDGWHAAISGEVILLVSFLSMTFLSKERTPVVVLAAIVSWGSVDVHHIQSSSNGIVATVRWRFESILSGINTRLFDPGKYLKDYDRAMKDVRNISRLPKLEGSSDIYRIYQADLIASGNEWNPRPVMQSYSAYTPSLVEMNKQHLLGVNRPDNIFFRLDSIDYRLPSLADGASLPILLSSYMPVSYVNNFLLLKARHTVVKPEPEMTLISEGRYPFGHRFKVPGYHNLLFVKLDVRPTFFGRIASLLYKPEIIQIKVVLKNGNEYAYRIIPEMAKTGFILSPLILNTNDFGRLYVPSKYRGDNEVSSIVLVTNNFYWKSDMHIEFYSIDTSPSEGYLKSLRPPKAVSNRRALPAGSDVIDTD